MREDRWSCVACIARAIALAIALALSSAACASVESGTAGEWRYTGERLRGRVLRLSRPVDIGGEGVRFAAPPVPCRLVRVEADARDIPLSTLLWVTITDGATPRELLLSNRFGHNAVLGLSRDAGTWSVRSDTFAADTDLLLTAVAVEWAEADWLFTGRIEGKAITDKSFPFPPYDRLVKLRNPRTHLRVYVEEIEPE